MGRWKPVDRAGHAVRQRGESIGAGGRLGMNSEHNTRQPHQQLLLLRVTFIDGEGARAGAGGVGVVYLYLRNARLFVYCCRVYGLLDYFTGYRHDVGGSQLVWACPLIDMDFGSPKNGRWETGGGGRCC